MPYCPNCKYEYVEGVEKCPDCDVELVSELPVEEVESMVPVYVAGDPNEATIVRGILEDAGIPVRERADVDKEMDAFAGPLGEEAIMVPASREAETKDILVKALKTGENLPSEESKKQE